MVNEATRDPVIMVVYGTRPEAIKVAPVIQELERTPGVRVHVVVTGQHREMLDQVNQLFGIEPDVDLNIMSSGQSLNSITARIVEKIDPIYERMEPDAVLVQGDTTTVLAAALAGFNRGVQVVHLEAGLRSGDPSSPFPEEGNRKLVSQIASLHLAPTEAARQNLLKENIGESSIVVTGNTVIDALLWAAEQTRQSDDQALEALNQYKHMLLLTTHRRENLGVNIDNIGRAIRLLAVQYPDIVTIWPAHKNPRARFGITRHVEDLPNVLRIEPASYGDFAHLMKRAHIILTDSGGIQEEAPSLGKPVLVLRDNTERPEAIDAGTVKLVGTRTKEIVAGVTELIEDDVVYSKMAQATNPYGDGTSARRVVKAMVDHMKLPSQ